MGSRNYHAKGDITIPPDNWIKIIPQIGDKHVAEGVFASLEITSKKREENHGVRISCATGKVSLRWTDKDPGDLAAADLGDPLAANEMIFEDEPDVTACWAKSHVGNSSIYIRC